MRQSGPLLTTNASDSGGGANIWNDPSNVTIDDDTFAYAAMPSGGDYTNALYAKGFGFNVPDIAIVDGIYVEIRCAGASTEDGGVRLLKAGTPSGDVKSGTIWSASASLQGYGADDDLWGNTLTPSDVNNANFGVLVSAHNISGGSTAYIYSIKMTVYWHYDIDVAETQVETRYTYKVYNPDGAFLGNLQGVAEDPVIPQEMNTVAYQLRLTVQQSADTAPLPSEYIVTESGEYLITEAGDRIRTEGADHAFTLGDNIGSRIQIKNGNRIVIHEYNYYYPNGHIIFSGQINRIEADFNSSNDIKILLHSDGLDADFYIARGAPFAYTDDQTQTTSNTSVNVTKSSTGVSQQYGQSVTIGTLVDNVGAISLKLNGTANVTVSVYSSANGSLLGSTTKSVSTGGVASVVQFGYANLIDTTVDKSIFFGVSVDRGQSIALYYASTDPYASGEMFSALYGGGGGGLYLPLAGYDLYFKVSSGTPTTTATYNSKDPTTEMLQPITEDYNVRGGRITVDEIDATGLSLSYTFNTNTYLEALKAVMKMCPSGFYFTVDPGTGGLTVKQAADYAEYTLIRGRHVDGLKVALSIENVINHVLFTGGDLGGGSNLYKEYYNQDSIDAYGDRLFRHVDNRVTSTVTAQAMSDKDLADSIEQYEIDVFVPNKNINTWNLKPGKVVTIAGYGNVLDGVLYQVIRRDYGANGSQLKLGTLQPRILPAIEGVIRGLMAQQTIANPSAPS